MPSDAHSWAGFEHRNFGGHYTFAGGGSLTFTAAVPEGASAEGLNANFNFFDFRLGSTGLTVPANLGLLKGWRSIKSFHLLKLRLLTLLLI